MPPKKTPGFGVKTGEVGTTVLAALITALVSLLCVPLIAAVLAYRQLVKWYLQQRYNCRFILMKGMDAACSLEPPPKILGYAVFLLVSPKTPFDNDSLEALRSKISGHLNTPQYKKLKYRACVKLGFCCWEDLGANKVDIRNHVKLCPGADSLCKVYSENEMMRVLQNVVNTDMDASTRPTWEVLVIPQVRTRSKTPQTTSQTQVALIARMNHGYMDGRSFKRFLQRCVFDDNLPQTIDQPSMRPAENLLEIGNCILYTLFDQIKETLCHSKSTIPANSSSDLHRIAHIKFESKTVSRIRKAFRCETLAVFCNALMAAIHELSNKKGIHIPNSLNVALAANIDLPPSTVEPTNVFNVYTRCIPFTGSDVHKQLTAINEKILDSPKNASEGGFRLLQLTGCLPVRWIRLFSGFAAFRPISITTFPMSEQVFRFQRGVVTSFVGMIRPVYGSVCALCPIYYGETFLVGLAISDIELVKNDLDMAAVTEYFRKHIHRLEKLATVDGLSARTSLSSGC